MGCNVLELLGEILFVVGFIVVVAVHLRNECPERLVLPQGCYAFRGSVVSRPAAGAFANNEHFVPPSLDGAFELAVEDEGVCLVLSSGRCGRRRSREGRMEVCDYAGKTFRGFNVCQTASIYIFYGLPVLILQDDFIPVFYGEFGLYILKPRN